MAVREVDTDIRVWCGELDPVGIGEFTGGAPAAVVLLGEHHDRPALGVSSDRLDNCAASASCSALTPGRNELGRLPVAERDGAGLVQQQVLTSPAASTARPDIASTLRCTSRSIPAMPMARQQRPDGGRDQADQQRHHDDSAHPVAGQRPESGPPGLLVLE